MKNIFKNLVPCCLLLFLGLSLACSQQQSFTILHTNDVHASFVPHEASWVKSDPKPMIGGFKELSWAIDSVRKARTTTILLDGGDVMTGNPIADYEYKGASGGALFEMMNMMGYDAWEIGNHDLDISQDNLRKLTSIATFPTVSANLTDSAGTFPLNNKPYVILKRGGLRIAVIGLMSKGLFSLTNTNNLKGLKVLPPVETTQKYIDEIEPQTDVTIALTHEGVDDDSILAASTRGLNVIIGAHSHTRLEKPRLINDVIVCQTGSNCENLGELDLTVDNHKVTKYEGHLLHLWVRHEEQGNQLSKLVDDVKNKIDQDYNGVLGTLVSDWKRASGESNIGDFVADAMREAAQADVGVTNSSGIRKDFSAGPIKKVDLFEISPFRNYLCTFTFTGKELRAFVEDEAKYYARGRAGLQTSGIRCTYKKKDDGIEMQSLKIGGVDIDDAKQYTIVTSDFLLNQADKYFGKKPTTSNCTTTLMLDALIAKVKRDKTIDSKIGGRFKEVN